MFFGGNENEKICFWNLLTFRQQQCLIYEPLCFKLRHYFLVQLQMKTIYRGGRERQAYLQWLQSLSEVAFQFFLQLIHSSRYLLYQSLVSLLLTDCFLQFMLFLLLICQICKTLTREGPKTMNSKNCGILTNAAKHMYVWRMLFQNWFKPKVNMLLTSVPAASLTNANAENFYDGR